MDQKEQTTIIKYFNSRKRSYNLERYKRRKINNKTSVRMDNFFNMGDGIETNMETVVEDGDNPGSDSVSQPETIRVFNRTIPELRYSRDELISLMDHPLSRIKPACLEGINIKGMVSNRKGGSNAENSGSDRKRGDSNCEDDKSHRRTAEPKERVRKEQEVVLSPQRRSFNSGCFVSLVAPQNRNFQTNEHRGGNHPENLAVKERLDGNHFGRDMNARRIGSGRIMARDAVWDYRTPEAMNVQEPQHNRQRDERFDKRSFDHRNNHEKEKTQKNNNRYGGTGNERRNTRYRSNENHTEEEPEWFSGGPTSQHDTIELHGFEEGRDDKPANFKKQNKKTNARKKSSSELQDHKLDKSDGQVKKQNQKKSKDNSMDKLADKFSEVRSSETSASNQTALSNSERLNASSSPTSYFNFDDFLKSTDRVAGFLSDQSEGEEKRGSKFSRWFHHDADEATLQDRSTPQEFSIFSSMITDFSRIGTKSETDSLFAPISPALISKSKSPNEEIDIISHDKSGELSPKRSSLMDLLKGGNRNDNVMGVNTSIHELEKSGKLHSVEELEANIRKREEPGTKGKEENSPAFQKLLSAINSKKSAKAATTRPDVAHLRHLFNKNSVNIPSGNSIAGEHKEQGAFGGFFQMPNFSQQPPNVDFNLANQMSIPPELVMKLLHVQQQQQAHQQPQQQQQAQQQHIAKLLSNNVNAGAGHLPPNLNITLPQFNVPPPISPLPNEVQQLINNAQPTNEVLQRPETQALLNGLKRGQISLFSMIEQLKKGASVQPSLREALACVIKMQQNQLLSGKLGPITPPNCDNGNPGIGNSDQLLHQIFLNQQQAQHQQQLRIPSPHNNLLQRVPRDIAVHNLMHSAFIKKKFEEQRDNFRKRQDLQRSSNSPCMGSSGNSMGSTHVTSTSPLSFTPTAVLRNMTANLDRGESPSSDSSKLANEISQSGNQQMKPSAVGYSPHPLRPNTPWDSTKPQKGRPIVKSTGAFNYPQQSGQSIPLSMDYSQLQYQNMQCSMNPQTNVMLQVLNVNQSGDGQANSGHQQQQQSNAVRPPLPQFNNGQMMNNSSAGRAVGRSTSPISNQLSRWFSPELLAQAKAGNLPDVMPSQKMMSVEELERTQQAVPN